MADSPLTKRMHLKPGMKLAVIGAPPGFRRLLEPLPEGVRLTTTLTGPSDIVQAFFRDRKQLLHKVPALKRALAAGGSLWICYPKLTSSAAGELSRDVIWKDLAPLGLRPVAQIAIDATWTGMRFKLAA